MLVIEYGTVADMLKPHAGEPFRAWQLRVRRATNMCRAGKPIAAFLMSPLSDEAARAYESGRFDADLIASGLPQKLAVPGVKKVTPAFEQKKPSGSGSEGWVESVVRR